MNCGVHNCPQRCHQICDHSKMDCQVSVTSKCAQGHTRSWKCHKPPQKSCEKCEREARAAEKKREKDLELQAKRDREQQEHQKKIALLDEEIERQRQKIKDRQEERAREIAIQQKLKDLEDAKAAAATPTPPPSFRRPPPVAQASVPPTSVPSGPGEQKLPNTQRGTTANPQQPQRTSASSSQIPLPDQSPSEKEWQRQKDMENASNQAIDQIMEMIGLEDVKSQVLKIKAKIDTAMRQNVDFQKERFGVTLLGNPGTGMLRIFSALHCPQGP